MGAAAVVLEEHWPRRGPAAADLCANLEVPLGSEIGPSPTAQSQSIGSLLNDEDLTFLDSSLADAVRYIHRRASAAVAAIEAADNSVKLNAALTSLISVKKEAFKKLLNDTIAESDMPFGEVSSNDDATHQYEHDASDDGQSDTTSSDGERKVGPPLSAAGHDDAEHVSYASNPNNPRG
ncbi:hypothetical protein GTA08_BOTSDO09549 [Botryosphaeria dothidea]|uniref:Uncharacterized protein n=1 Tax=Botryosphaeria dothidea TaxID=55169 RepID=A0A8H4IMB7_9PEZI|nr:hypothetical protein GTA08_BOTSDO09549 [Botryosphaeria dothidea]